MPFMGVVHANARRVLANWVPKLPPRAHIICSGNFSLETTLRANGYQGKITGCDVSVYTSMLGAYLAGGDIPLVMDFERFPELEAMGGYLEEQEGRAACVALALDVLQFHQRKNSYQNRMMDAYVKRLPELIDKTRERLRKKREAVRLDEFHAMDGSVRIGEIEPGEEDVVLSFPPTYKNGYERLYRHLDELCIWAKPDYRDLSGLCEFAGLVVARPGPWILGAELPSEEFHQIVGEPIAKTPRGSQVNVYLYSNLHIETAVVRRQMNLTECRYPRFGDGDEIKPDSKLEVVPIDAGEAAYIRAVYSSVTVAQCTGMWNFAVTVDGKMIGVLVFQPSTFDVKIDGEPRRFETVYMMADLAIADPRYRRLSKLVLLASISREVRHELERRMIQEVKYVVTTAFSKHQESMKYRGVYKLLTRSESKDDAGITRLNYYGDAGSYTLEQALKLWLRKHHKPRKEPEA